MPRRKGEPGLIHLYKNSFTLTQTKCNQVSARATSELILVNCQKCLKAVEVKTVHIPTKARSDLYPYVPRATSKDRAWRHA